MITAQDIEKLFDRFLAEISDAGLRGEVIAVWVEGSKRGGWGSVADLQKLPFTLATDARGLSLVEHTRTVTAGALGLGRAQREHYSKPPFAINFDYLVAGAAPRRGQAPGNPARRVRRVPQGPRRPLRAPPDKRGDAGL